MLSQRTGETGCAPSCWGAPPAGVSQGYHVLMPGQRESVACWAWPACLASQTPTPSVTGSEQTDALLLCLLLSQEKALQGLFLSPGTTGLNYRKAKKHSTHFMLPAGTNCMCRCNRNVCDTGGAVHIATTSTALSSSHTTLWCAEYMQHMQLFQATFVQDMRFTHHVCNSGMQQVCVCALTLTGRGTRYGV